MFDCEKCGFHMDRVIDDPRAQSGIPNDAVLTFGEIDLEPSAIPHRERLDRIDYSTVMSHYAAHAVWHEEHYRSTAIKASDALDAITRLIQSDFERESRV